MQIEPLKKQSSNRALLPTHTIARSGVTEDMIPGLAEHSTRDPRNSTTPRLPSQDQRERLFVEAMK